MSSTGAVYPFSRWSDLERLVSVKPQEGQRIELKSRKELKIQSSTEGSVKWSLGSDTKNKIATCVAGLANASGGTLILGVDEKGETPCERLEPFAPLGNLEISIRDYLRDAIDPPAPVEVSAVKRDDDVGEDEGVLVFHVGSSSLGPHQVIKSGMFPIRRDASTQSMKGGEVHNMVLGNYWRDREVEETLRQRSERFLQFCRGKGAPEQRFLGIRMTAVPQSPHIQIQPRLAPNQRLSAEWRPPSPELKALDSEGKLIERYSPPSTMNCSRYDWRALLRACRGEHTIRKVPDESTETRKLWSSNYCEIHADGLLELGEARWTPPANQIQVRIGQILCQIGTLMAWVDTVRLKAQLPGADYQIYVEVDFSTTVSSYQDFPGNSSYALHEPPRACRFFPFPVGNADEQNDILATVRRDLYNWMGLEPKSTHSYHLGHAIQTDSQQSAK